MLVVAVTHELIGGVLYEVMVYKRNILIVRKGLLTVANEVVGSISLHLLQQPFAKSY